ICYTLLDKYKGTGVTGHSMFLYELNKNGITIERMKNKQGKVYGLKFSFNGQSFKASEIGREFGYHSLQNDFETTNKEETRKPHLTVQEPTEKKEQSDTGYQLVPPSRSSISRDNDTSQGQNPIGAVADTIISAADDVVEGLGDLITPSAHGDDYAETAWQRKLRNQANRKKRGRRL
ncbi:mobilization protein, partial [Prevotella disiens]